MEGIEGFIWLEWVVEKLITKHSVLPEEVEESFFNVPYKVRQADEGKYRLYSRSGSGRYLFIVFTWQGRQIKVISARDMTQAERHLYTRK